MHRKYFLCIKTEISLFFYIDIYDIYDNIIGTIIGLLEVKVILVTPKPMQLAPLLN